MDKIIEKTNGKNSQKKFFGNYLQKIVVLL